MSGRRPARDLTVLDALDALPREAFAGEVWRVVREGRDPLLGGRSSSRWCDATFDVLYTSLERDGAVAEIHALLALQPVFPSKIRWFANRLRVSAAQTLKLADLPTLARLGVDTDRYADRDYSRTQPVAEAAFFLGFDGLIAPSARWRSPQPRPLHRAHRAAADRRLEHGKRADRLEPLAQRLARLRTLRLDGPRKSC